MFSDSIRPEENIKYENFHLYETTQMYYLIACDPSETNHRILKIDRSFEKPKYLSQILREDPLKYTKEDIADLLAMIHDGNLTCGGIIKIATGYGLVGFVKFLDNYYFTLITQRKLIGNICTNNVYSIKATETFAIRPKEKEENSTISKIWSTLNKKFNQSPLDIAESRYMGLYQFVDLTKDFYYSYSYDMTHSLQNNYTIVRYMQSFDLSEKSQDRLSNIAGVVSTSQEMFEWNYYQTSELKSIVSDSSWIIPIIHGSYQQKRFSMLGRPLDIILIARRSRHYAGTRYLKRGINVHGKVANDVEVEQIMQLDGGMQTKCCSYIQMRGSIPTYWSQETSVTMPKPPILLNRRDPTYLATQEHFADLMRRYNSPIIVLDLVKQLERKPRESIVGREFREAVDEINLSIPLQNQIWYFALDYSRVSKRTYTAGGTIRSGRFEADKSPTGQEWDLFESSLTAEEAHRPAYTTQVTGPSQHQLAPASSRYRSGTAATMQSQSTVTAPTVHRIEEMKELGDISAIALEETGIFCSTSTYLDHLEGINPSIIKTAKEVGFMTQNGVLRTNCIDCLDRTNVAQFSMGMKLLSVSLRALGLTDNGADPSSPMVKTLINMYSDMGDRIALQYGGSEAHKKVSAAQENGPKQGELLTSIKRYYSNAFTDNVKQDAMNVFLGVYVPNERKMPLWEMDTDYYIHNKVLHPPTPYADKILFSDTNRLEDQPDSTPGHHDAATVRQLLAVVKADLEVISENILSRYLIKGITNSSEHNKLLSDSKIISKIRKREMRKRVNEIMKNRYQEAFESWWKDSTNKNDVTSKFNQNKSQSQSSSLLLMSSSSFENQAVRNSTSVKTARSNITLAASKEQYFQRMYEPESFTFFDEVATAEFLSTMDAKTTHAMTWGSHGDHDLYESFNETEDSTNSGITRIDDEKVAVVTDVDQLLENGETDGPREGSSMNFLFNALSGSYLSVSQSPRQSNLQPTTVGLSSANAINGNRPLPQQSPQNSPQSSYSHSGFINDQSPSHSPRQSPQHFTQNNNSSFSSVTSAGDTGGSGSFQSAYYNARDSIQRPHSNNTFSARPSGVILTRYLRDIGVKAGKFVGGLLGRDANSSQNLSMPTQHSQHQRRDQYTSTIANSRVPESSTLLYSKYADIANDSTILFNSTNLSAEQDFVMSLREFNISDDDVQAMEHLAADNCIFSKIPEGIYEGASQGDSAIAASSFLFASMIHTEADLRGIHFADDPFVTPLQFDTNFNLNGTGDNFSSQAIINPPTLLHQRDNNLSTSQHTVANVGPMTSHRAATAPVDVSVSNPSVAISAPGNISSSLKRIVQVPSSISQKLSTLSAQAEVCVGLSNELQKHALNYLIQQTSYGKQINPERLSKRLSTLTSERIIMKYMNLYDKDAIVQELDTILYMIKDSSFSYPFNDLEAILHSLLTAHLLYVSRKRIVINEIEKIAKEGKGINSKKNIDKMEGSTSSAVNGTRGDIISELRILYEILAEKEGRQYIGVTQNAPNVYTRNTNPYLVMNQAAALGFSRVFHRERDRIVF